MFDIDPLLYGEPNLLAPEIKFDNLSKLFWDISTLHCPRRVHTFGLASVLLNSDRMV